MQNEQLSEGIRIVLKFSQVTHILLRGEEFVSSEGENISDLNGCLSREPAVEIYSLFGVSPEMNQELSTG